MLEPDGSAIRMLNPFSGVPTPYRVETGERSWFGNCVWDAFGIPAALGVDGHVSATCLDCGEALEVDVVAGRPEPDDLVAHILLPAERWWDDISLHLKHDEPLPVGGAHGALAEGERL